MEEVGGAGDRAGRVRKKKRHLKSKEEIELEIQRRVEEALLSESLQKEIEAEYEAEVKKLVCIVTPDADDALRMLLEAQETSALKEDKNEDERDNVVQEESSSQEGTRRSVVNNESCMFEEKKQQESGGVTKQLPAETGRSKPESEEKNESETENMENISMNASYPPLPQLPKISPNDRKKLRNIRDGSLYDQLILQWVNDRLLHRGIKVESVKTGFSDGYALCCLIEECSGVPLPFEVFRPSGGIKSCRIKSIENLHQAFAYMKQQNIRVVSCSPVDIVDGQETLIRGLLWSFYQKYADRGAVPELDSVTRLTEEEEKIVSKRMTDISKIVLCQSVARAWLFRRHYQKLLKDNRHRKHVAVEIFETEKAYLERLNAVVKVYMHPLQLMEFHDGEVVNVNVSKEEIHSMFCNIHEIMVFHTIVLEALTKRLDEWSNTQKIADVFLAHVPYFKLYIMYCKNYDHAVRALNELRQRRSGFKDFLEKAGGKEGAIAGVALESLLIVPIQRIPRYILMLKDILKHTLMDHPDFDDLCMATAKFEEIALELNEEIHNAHRTSKVLAVQLSLNNVPNDFVLMNPFRYYLTAGDAFLCHFDSPTLGTDTTQAKLHLFNDSLIITEKATNDFKVFISFDTSMALSGKNDVECKLLSMKEMVDLEHVGNLFVLLTSDRTWVLHCSTPSQRQAWVDSIAEAVKAIAERNKGRGITSSAPEIWKHPQVTITETQNRKDHEVRLPYTVYLILVTMPDGTLHKSARRYSDFDDLHRKIRKAYPDLHMPELPAKRITSGLIDKQMIDYRRVMLEAFLSELLSKKYMLKCKDLRYFLNIGVDMKEDPWGIPLNSIEVSASDTFKMFRRRSYSSNKPVEGKSKSSVRYMTPDAILQDEEGEEEPLSSSGSPASKRRSGVLAKEMHRSKSALHMRAAAEAAAGISATPKRDREGEADGKQKSSSASQEE